MSPPTSIGVILSQREVGNDWPITKQSPITGGVELQYNEETAVSYRMGLKHFRSHIYTIYICIHIYETKFKKS